LTQSHGTPSSGTPSSGTRSSEERRRGRVQERRNSRTSGGSSGVTRQGRRSRCVEDR
jgi:hypothetical protein